VEQSAAAVAARLAGENLDWVVCYQSRVGPLEWIGPAIGEEIARAGKERVPVVVVPIAFVSEHSETLVELDIDYRRVAEAAGVPRYIRLATVGVADDFVRGLARLVGNAAAAPSGLATDGGRRLCPSGFSRCPLQAV
jgi:ferrochelatase